MIEAGVVIDLDGEPIFWHAPNGRSPGSIPDSRDLWEVIWENRRKILGIAHSHPGCGFPQPSDTDLTTFAAVESALGSRLIWWIVSNDKMSAVCWMGPGRLDYQDFPNHPMNDPGWVSRLREISEFSQWDKEKQHGGSNCSSE